jgi:hypothetical protein
LYADGAYISGRAISELVRGHGLRRTRYKGFAKVDLQNQLIAAACNIKRWFRKLLGTIFATQTQKVVLNVPQPLAAAKVPGSDQLIANRGAAAARRDWSKALP